MRVAREYNEVRRSTVPRTPPEDYRIKVSMDVSRERPARIRAQ